MSARVTGKRIESASRSEDGGVEVEVGITVAVQLTVEQVVADAESGRLKPRRELVALVRQEVRDALR